MKIFFKFLVGAVLALVLISAGALAWSWAPDRPVSELTQRWAPPPSQFIEVAGMQVHLRDEGPRDDAHPIVLIHGTSASLHTWDGWVDALKPTRRVIRIDLPGFGLTGPHPQKDYSLAAYSAFMAELLGKLQVQQAVLGGNSLGGEVAWHVALDHPQLVSRLVLVDSGGYPFKAQSMPVAFQVAKIPALRPLLTHTLPRGMVESSVRSVYGDPSKVTPELVDRYYELSLREGNRAALSDRYTVPVGAESASIKRITQPTLIIWGGQDRLIPPENAKLFAQDVPGSRLVMFDDLGHVPQEEDPARTVAALQEFLAAHP